MSDISEVIGWKFNHQPGMRCREIDGVIQIVDFPGGVPSQKDQADWTAEYEAFVAGGGLKQRDAERQMDATIAQRFLFEVDFNQENRIRALEGRAAVTREQFRDALVQLYKSLG